MPNIVTTARKLKITVVIDSAPFVQLGVPPDNAPPRTVVTVTVGGRTLVADIATKSRVRHPSTAPELLARRADCFGDSDWTLLPFCNTQSPSE